MCMLVLLRMDSKQLNYIYYLKCKLRLPKSKTEAWKAFEIRAISTMLTIASSNALPANTIKYSNPSLIEHFY